MDGCLFLVAGKNGKIAPILKKGRKGGPWELLTCQPHVSAWEDHGTDPSRRYACPDPISRRF